MQFSGTVLRGQGTGRTNGFPTVNIPLTSSEVSGVYIATVRVDGQEFPAAAFADQHRKLLEAYILDFDGDLYEREVTISLISKIRDAARFENESDLLRTIAADVHTVREHFTL